MNKDEKQSIYEIYRACRLCGAGAGYKMPIIQSVIDVDGEGTELKQKIRECIQLEVSLNDRMPPLICELCVDKLNDFFEFRAMCHENNKKTRLRLGLPLQEVPEVKAAPDTEDCILSITEPVCVDSDTDEGEPLSKQTSTVKSKPRPKSVKLKEGDVKIKIVNYQPVMKDKLRSPSPESPDRRETRTRQEPSPKRTTRQSKLDEMFLSELEGVKILTKPPLRPRVGPKSVMRREQEILQAEKENETSEESEDEKNSLLVPRSKRPREKEITNLEIEEINPPVKKARPEPPKQEKPKPGPKSSKVIPKPTPPQKPPPPTPKPGPKSKKRDPSPLPIPKSRKSEPTPKSRNSEPSPVPTPKTRRNEPSPVPTPKSRKKELSPVPNPKSRKKEPSPVPAAKSRKSETVPGPKSRKSESVPGPKSKKREPSPVPSPAPKSKKSDSLPASISKSKKPEPSPHCARASPPPHKSHVCTVCGQKAKAAQGLSSHMKIHVVGFTPVKLSCNPCEIWFSSSEEAACHHRQHSATGQPYTCAKCYDDFRTMKDYELHFTHNQCLPTYEVPDVKCEECWHFFPTYKLLEDHKCPGEGGRPGGKCSKCKRTYSMLKSLTAHEIRCSIKKKVQKVEPTVDPEVFRRLLPMEVRISRCDSLLKNTTDNRCDVSGVSHRFGLDSSCSYPYLYSMGEIRIKTEVSGDTFDPMVAINDEIKEEYLNNDTKSVHWDSDASSDSDNDISGTSFDSNKVDTLSTISLKTIFSPKCLGKVPRKKRKVKSQKGIGSILSINFPGDIKKNIDNIIDNLGNETHSDNDSDSILHKSLVLNKRSDTFDKFRANVMHNITSDNKTEEENDVLSNESDKYDSELVENKIDSSKDKENRNKVVNITQNSNNDLNTDNNKEIHTDNHIEGDINKVTNASNTESVEPTNTKTIQSKNALNASENNLDRESKSTEDIIHNNNDKFKDDLINDPETAEKVADESEPSCIEDKVGISTPQTLEKINTDELMEPKSANIGTIADINFTLTNNEVEMSKFENVNILPNSDEKESDINADNNDSQSSDKDDSQSSDAINYKGIEDLNTDNGDSQSSVAIAHAVDENSNAEKTDSQTSDGINHESIENVKNDDAESSDAINYKGIEDLNTEKADSQSSDAINYITTENNDSNSEKTDSQSTDAISYTAIVNSTVENSDSQSNNVAIDQSNHSDCTKTESNNTVEDFNVSDKANREKNEASMSNSISYPNNDDENLENNVQCVDKFNINDLNDEEKRLMEELDAQIGEDQSSSNDIGGNRPENAVSSENRQEKFSENKSESRPITGNKPENGEISENKQSEFSRSVNPCLVMGNVGFGDLNSEENTFDSLIQKQDDLTSLDLDSISDEEFDFDI